MKAILKIPIVIVLLIFSGVTVTFADKKGAATHSADAEFAPVSAGVQATQYLRFGQLTTEDGLSNNAIWGLTQDTGVSPGWAPIPA